MIISIDHLRKHIKFIAILLLCYLVIGMVLFFSQRSLIYHPDNQDFDACEEFKHYERQEVNGTRFYYHNSDSPNVVIYYHGNAGSACDRSYAASFFEKFDTSLIFVEYTGYSHDSQKPSQAGILNDVENIDKFVMSEKYKNIILYGQSIGSGAASYHSSFNNATGIILVTPFFTMTELIQSKVMIYPTSLLLQEKYDNLKWLHNHLGSVLIVHGDQDSVIPHKFSQKLYRSLSSNKKEYILIPNKGHNDIWSSGLFQEKISAYLKNQISHDK